MGHRLIHIPHDLSEQPLREVEVMKLDTRTIADALFEDSSVMIESVRPLGLRHLHDVANRRILALLVDEEGLLKSLPFNTRASVLYGAHVHGAPIVGDAYVIGEVQEITSDGPDWVWQSLPAHITEAVIADAIDTSATDVDRFRL